MSGRSLYMALSGIVVGGTTGLLAHGLVAVLSSWGRAAPLHDTRDASTAVERTMAGAALGVLLAALLAVVARRATASTTRHHHAGIPSLVLLSLVYGLLSHWLRAQVEAERVGELRMQLEAIAAALSLASVLSLRGWLAALRKPVTRGRLRKLGLATVLVLGPVAVLGLRAQPPSADASRPNVVMVVVDCLRPDHLGAYGGRARNSPAFDRLAERGRLFERVYSTASWTKPAVASLVTGLDAHEHGVLRMPDALPETATTAAEAFRAAGYDTLFVGGGNSWIGRAYNFHQGYRHFAPDAGWGQAVVERFAEHLRDAQGAPLFAYLHFMDVHMPYGTNAHSTAVARGPLDHPRVQPGRLHSPWVRQREAAGMLWPRDRQRIAALYDAQVRYVDEQLRAIVELLSERGLGRTLLVVTADHGEELWEHGTFGHGHSVRETPMRVPLLLMGPGLKPGRVKQPASLIDVLPTMLAYAGIEAPAGLRGHTLLEAPRPRPRALHLSSTMYGRDKFGAVLGELKVVETFARQPEGARFIGRDTPLGRAHYDLSATPLEKAPAVDGALPQGPRGVLDEALQQAASSAHIATGGTGAGPAATRTKPVAMDPATMERLRQLGYMQ